MTAAAPEASEESDSGAVTYPKVTAADDECDTKGAEEPDSAEDSADAGAAKADAGAAKADAGAAASSCCDASRVEALVMWKDPKQSAAVAGTLFVALYFGTFVLVEWALLIALVAAGGLRAYNNYKGDRSAATFTVPVSRADLLRAAELVADAVWSIVSALNDVLAWRSIETSLRALAYVWLLFTFGVLSDVLYWKTLHMAVLIGAFTVPLVMSKFGDQVKAQLVPVLAPKVQQVQGVYGNVTQQVSSVTANVPAQALQGGLALVVVLFAWLAPSASVTAAALLVTGFNLGAAASSRLTALRDAKPHSE